MQSKLTWLCLLTFRLLNLILRRRQKAAGTAMGRGTVFGPWLKGSVFGAELGASGAEEGRV